MSKPNKEFEIPAKFLNQLNEFTDGAYILFTIKDGSPVIHTKFDDEISCLGLVKFVQIWSQSMEELNSAAIFEDLTGGEPEDGEDFGDEKE